MPFDLMIVLPPQPQPHTRQPYSFRSLLPPTAFNSIPTALQNVSYKKNWDAVFHITILSTTSVIAAGHVITNVSCSAAVLYMKECGLLSRRRLANGVSNIQ